MNKINMLFIGLMISAIALSGCSSSDDGGGGGVSGPTYSGAITPAAITEDNAETLATTATEASREAIVGSAASQANPFNPFGISITQADDRIHQLIADISRKILESSGPDLNLPLGVTYTHTELNAEYGGIFCGGSVTVPDNFNGNGTITYNNLCINDPYLGLITINGSVIFTDTSTSFSIQYVNFTISFAGETYTFNMTVTCTYEPLSCSVSSDFVGSDGLTYRIADIDVWDNYDGSYDIYATFYHPEHGSVTISGIDILFDCDSGYPKSGTLTITGTGSSEATVTFVDCTTYTVNWYDGTNSGSFGGNWP